MQTRRQSITEAGINTGTGMVISFITTQLLAPVLGIDLPISSNLILTCVLTCVSIGRSYMFRRYFNRRGKR